MTRKGPYKDTAVPIGRSRDAIDRMLTDAGAVGIQWTEIVGRGVVLRFKRNGLTFRVPAAYLHSDEKGKRQAHRFIFYYLKNVLASELFWPLEQQLLAHIEPKGEEGPTIWQWIGPQLERLEERPLLPGVAEAEIGPVAEERWEVLPPPDEE